MKSDVMRNVELEGALIACYHRYERIVTSILRDKKLSNDFSSWCLKEDLRSMYAEISDLVFGDSIEMHREFGSINSGLDLVRVTQALNFESNAELEGYENGVRDWIKRRLIPKKQGEVMIRNHREEYAKEKPKRDAHSFALALVRFGVDTLRTIYALAGEDFVAAFKNFKTHMPDKARDYEYVRLEDSQVAETEDK